METILVGQIACLVTKIELAVNVGICRLKIKMITVGDRMRVLARGSKKIVYINTGFCQISDVLFLH